MTLHIRPASFSPATLRHPFTYEYLIEGAVAAVFEGTAIIGPCAYDPDSWEIEGLELDAIACGPETSRPLATTVTLPATHVLYRPISDFLCGPGRAVIEDAWAAQRPALAA